MNTNANESGGSKEGTREIRDPWKFGKTLCWRPPARVNAPALEKSWICHWMNTYEHNLWSSKANKHY